jgi:hypothetical protein
MASPNYAPGIPHDKNSAPMQGLPSPIPGKVVYGVAPPAASSVITLGPNTTMIEITALNASLAFKWGSPFNNPSVIATAGATYNADHIVPVNSTRRFVVPVSVYGVRSVVGANAFNGLYNSIAVVATPSVLTALTEF